MSFKPSAASERRKNLNYPRQLDCRPDLLANRNLDTTRKTVLETLQRQAASGSELKIDLPIGGALRMRRLVHRGTQRPVFRVPSITLGRTVECESLLEVDAAIVMDADPRVDVYAEQPVRIHYHDSTGGHWHIPDFFVRRSGALTFEEIKFSTDVDDAVRARTNLLADKLKPLGFGYRLLTEVEIRQKDSVQNAVRVLRRARHRVDDVQQLATLERLRICREATLADFGWRRPGSRDAVCVARLILSGSAVVTTDGLLTEASHVSINEPVAPKEAHDVTR